MFYYTLLKNGRNFQAYMIQTTNHFIARMKVKCKVAPCAAFPLFLTYCKMLNVLVMMWFEQRLDQTPSQEQADAFTLWAKFSGAFLYISLNPLNQICFCLNLNCTLFCVYYNILYLMVITNFGDLFSLKIKKQKR